MEAFIFSLLNVVIILYLVYMITWTRQCETQFPRVFRFLFFLGLGRQRWNMFDDADGYSESHIFRLYYKDGSEKDFTFVDPSDLDTYYKQDFTYHSYAETFLIAPWLVTGIVNYLYDLYEGEIDRVGYISKPVYHDFLSEEDEETSRYDYENQTNFK